ncbi:MAG TPA: TetR/AcrR family transcriptional regulator [Candidatus Dormibacteraeota bacterium]|jgi:TetR/AcrR family fatty acid metabolism transcriptional regulator|nr:TetR/AcrR family transcriptional regulator [Candidatus Dormibacteraeota bacterium]
MSSAPSPSAAKGQAQSRPRGTRRSARTRERILQAATEVFARRGFHGARVADIAEVAGIAYGLVYHHFRNKDEILAAIFSERWSAYVRYIDDMSGSPEPFRAKMAHLVHFWVENWRQDPHLMTVMINEISRSYEFLESHDVETVLVAFDAVERLLTISQARGEVRDDLDAKLVTYAILGVAEMVLTGYVMNQLRRDAAGAYAKDEAQLVTLLLDGLATR